MAKLLSIVIPSRNERFLSQTVRDVCAKAAGDVEIFPVLDGYEPPPDELVDDPRVTYIRFPKVSETRKRHAINHVAEISNGDYLMSLDAHCMLAPGFDRVLLEDHEDHWVSVPRRHRLDPIHWSLQPQSDDRPPIDYEYTMWPPKFDPWGLHGFKWDARTLERRHIDVDDTMHFQGSCWLMTKAWFKECGFMQIEGYTGWGQEAEEIGLTTKFRGGRVMTNKRTWYAHLHKGPTYGRMYHMSRESVRACNRYAYDRWVRGERWFFENFVDSFWPVPGWPNDWREQLWP